MTKSRNYLNKEIDKFKRNGEIQKAIEFCQTILLKEPNRFDLHVRLGDLYMDWHLDVYQAKQYIDKITLSLVQFNQSGISAAQSSASAANTIIQNEKRKQQAYNETAQAAKSMNGIVQNGSFPKNFLVSELNGSTKEVENTFKKLSSIVSIEERLGDATNLKGFTVSLTNADGVVEKLRYHLNEAGDAFTYMGGSVNNTGVEKQINSINEKASKLQNTFEGLKSKYSDLNAANPIKEVSHISELETQYKRVSQAIEAVKNSNSATFSSMTSNAEKEIKTLQRMGEEFKRAETISMRMNGSDISSGLAQAQERFQKLKADSDAILEIRTKELKFIVATSYASISNELYKGYLALENYFVEISKYND